VGITLGLLLFTNCDGILRVMGANAEIFPFARQFLLIRAVAAPAELWLLVAKVRCNLGALPRYGSPYPGGGTRRCVLSARTLDRAPPTATRTPRPRCKRSPRAPQCISRSTSF